MSIKKYKKKPIVIEAVQWFGDVESTQEVMDFIGELSTIPDNRQIWIDERIRIKTLEGTMTASIGDYIIKGAKGEFYPCKPDVFEMTYEEVDE